jgi:cytochrome c
LIPINAGRAGFQHPAFKELAMRNTSTFAGNPSPGMRRVSLLAGVSLIMAGCASVEGASFGESLSPAVRRGEMFAQINCASCHAIGSNEDSPNLNAPPFRRVRVRYNPLSLKRELEAIPAAGHYLMKPIRIEPTDVEDLIAYIESLD